MGSFCFALGLGNTKRLAYHHRGPRTEYEAHNVEISLSSRLSPYSHNPTGEPVLSLDPPILCPVGYEPY